MSTTPNIHSNRKLFLHEKTKLKAGSIGRFIDGFSNQYQPQMEKAGARLFGTWESSSINGHWPEVTTLWEIDSYQHLSDIGRERHSNPAVRQPYEQWLGLLGELDGHGEGRLVFANPGFKTVAERKAEGFKTTMAIEEIMTTKPNGQTKYVEELEYLYVPWSEDTGKKWIGSFTTIFRYDEVIHFWACDGGWDVFAKHFPSVKAGSPDPRYRAWMSVAPAIRDGWEDTFLQSLPANPLG